MTVFQLLHWNGSLKAMRERQCSRQVSCHWWRAGHVTTVLTLRMRSFSACIKFHDRENMPDTDGICVANHTSPIGTSTFVTLKDFIAKDHLSPKHM